jgi:hypothetical protein
MPFGGLAFEKSMGARHWHATKTDRSVLSTWIDAVMGDGSERHMHSPAPEAVLRKGSAET